MGLPKLRKGWVFITRRSAACKQEKNCFVERAAKLLAVIGFDNREETVIIKGEQTAEVAKALISMLEHLKGETPYCANSAGASERKHMGM